MKTITKLIFVCLLSIQAHAYAFKVKALYFNELIFVVEVDNHDMTIQLRGCTPKQNKTADINWLMRKHIKNNKIRIEDLRIENKILKADMYINKKKLTSILKAKHFCK